MSYMTKSTRMQKNDVQGKLLVLFSGLPEAPPPVLGERADPSKYFKRSWGVQEVEALVPPASWF